jgi:hypothetical protein
LVELCRANFVGHDACLRAEGKYIQCLLWFWRTKYNINYSTLNSNSGHCLNDRLVYQRALRTKRSEWWLMWVARKNNAPIRYEIVRLWKLVYGQM